MNSPWIFPFPLYAIDIKADGVFIKILTYNHDIFDRPHLAASKSLWGYRYVRPNNYPTFTPSEEGNFKTVENALRWIKENAPDDNGETIANIDRIVAYEKNNIDKQ